MLRKNLLKLFHEPIICDRINLKKFPWGWKSNEEIYKNLNYSQSKPINSNEFSYSKFSKEYLLNQEEKPDTYIHEYKIKEFAGEMYTKTYLAYLNNYDFLNTVVFSPKLAIGLNYLRSKSDMREFNSEIKINNIKIINSWIKFGRLKNNAKFLGYYNEYEILHELTAGILGPEISSIWDQKSIKQKIKISVDVDINKTEYNNEIDKRNDVLEFERDLMTTNSKWQLSNINWIVK